MKGGPFSRINSMTGFFVLIAVLCGCEKNPEQIFRALTGIQSKKECFERGGVEYQYGSSGGEIHAVCVFRRIDGF